MPRRRTAAERDEQQPWRMNNLAVLLALQKRDLNEVRQLVEKAIEITGPLPALLDSRATVYLALGKPGRRCPISSRSLAKIRVRTANFTSR